jgi:hypothetical protein
VFASPMGGPLRHANFYRRVWVPTLAKADLPGIRFHDLRHAENALTAEAGASLRELMDRMGHSSTRAGQIYQHSSDERQRKLADAVGQAARAALGKNGPHLARAWHARPQPLENVRPLPGYKAMICGFPGAPGRTRTCDQLLRRQLLYPTELRALGNKCGRRRSRLGHIRVAVCRDLTLPGSKLTSKRR